MARGLACVPFLPSPFTGLVLSFIRFPFQPLVPRSLPKAIGKLKHLFSLNVEDNPLKYPPADFVEEGDDAILEFLRTSRHQFSGREKISVVVRNNRGFIPLTANKYPRLALCSRILDSEPRSMLDVLPLLTCRQRERIGLTGELLHADLSLFHVLTSNTYIALAFRGNSLGRNTRQYVPG